LSPDRIRSVRHYDGMPIDAQSVADAILRQEGRPTAPMPAEPPVGVTTDRLT
jgi:hypothetical protein